MLRLLCKDCRWVDWRVPGDALSAVCRHPTSLWQPKPDVVTGDTPPAQPLPCREARQQGGSGGAGDCGPEGKHWEPAAPPGFV